MTTNPQTIPDLELEEMEAWRIYQAHAVETERLRRQWCWAYKLLRAKMNKDRREQALCNTSSP